MRPRDASLATGLQASLSDFDQSVRRLPGLDDPIQRSVFVEQLLESVHRVRYVAVVQARGVSSQRADPTSDLFDPVKAAMHLIRIGDIEEAFWMVFLFVHFGKRHGGWRYARETYGQLGQGGVWNWRTVSRDPGSFRTWLASNNEEIGRPGGGFGNHRKYESLDAWSASGTGAVVESYVQWVGPPRTHAQLFRQKVDEASGDARKAFDLLYRSMNAVTRFGRTARFDYLAMVGKLGLARIAPGSPYFGNATGPKKGAQLLFGKRQTAAPGSNVLDRWVGDLDSRLNIGMQALEDALCNWQKSPKTFKAFRG